MMGNSGSYENKIGIKCRYLAPMSLGSAVDMPGFYLSATTAPVCVCVRAFLSAPVTACL